MQQGKGLKFFLAITAIFLVGVIGYFTLFLIPQNFYNTESEVNVVVDTNNEVEDNMSNWQTHSNSTFGFSISYPPDWRFEDSSESRYVQLFNYPMEKYPGGSKFQDGDIKIEIYIRSGKGSETSTNIPYETVSESSVIIGDYTFLEKINNSGSHSYLLEINDSTYSITVHGDYNGEQELVRQVISTFRLVDPELASQEWQVYTDNEFGISFSYPPIYYFGKPKAYQDREYPGLYTQWYFEAENCGHCLPLIDVEIGKIEDGTTFKEQLNKNYFNFNNTDKETFLSEDSGTIFGGTNGFETVTIGGRTFLKIVGGEATSAVRYYRYEGDVYVGFIDYFENDIDLTKRIAETVKFDVPEEISEWQTYTNEEIGFEFKYPPSINVERVEFYGLRDSNGKIITRSGKDWYFLRLAVEGEGLSSTLFVNDAGRGFQGIFNEAIQENILIGGLSGKKRSDRSCSEVIDDSDLTVTLSEENCGSFISFEHSINTYFHFSLYKDFESGNNLIEQIYSTFKFIEPTDISDWQTYSNEEFGLSIKIPPEFKLVGEVRGLTISKYTSLIRLAFGQEKNFGPGYDGEFFIFVFDREEGIKKNIIFGTGAQFSDRKEEQKAVEVSGVIAYKFTILTEQRENWIMESVFVESDDKLFWIHNGALPNFSFESFYESFVFTN